MVAKRGCEVGAYLVIACAGAVVAFVYRPDGDFIAALAKYVVAAWIVVRCRVLYVSLPLATLVFWGLSIGPELLGQHQQDHGSGIFSQVVSFQGDFRLILAALYSSLCYGVASAFYAVWSRQDRPGHLRTVVALVSAAQLFLAAVSVLVVEAEPRTTAFKVTLVLLFTSLGLGSLQGFMLHRGRWIRTAFRYFNWLEVGVWLAYVLIVERFAEMSRIASRWRGSGILPLLGIAALTLCVANGILTGLIPSHAVGRVLQKDWHSERRPRGQRAP